MSIELPLAGIGSRFIAVLVDSLILGAVFLFLLIFAAFLLPALGAFGAKAATWGVGVFILIFFLIFWGYFALIEAFNNGRTPGKRVARIRVIHQSGRGISFVEVAGPQPGASDRLGARLLRRGHCGHLPEPAAPAAGRHGGGNAGGAGARSRCAHVGRERIAHLGRQPIALFDDRGAGRALADASDGFAADDCREPPWGGPPHLRVTLPAQALSKLTASDLEVLEGFFARRLDMDLATRGALALRIATALCAKSGLTIPAETSVETFLEAVAHQFRELGRMS